MGNKRRIMPSEGFPALEKKAVMQTQQLVSFLPTFTIHLERPVQNRIQ